MDEAFVQPRLPDGSLATLTGGSSSASTLLALHRRCCASKKQRLEEPTISARVSVRVIVRRLPVGANDARHFYLSLWGLQDGELGQLTEESRVACAAGTQPPEHTVVFKDLLESEIAGLTLVCRAYRVGRLRSAEDEATSSIAQSMQLLMSSNSSVDARNAALKADGAMSKFDLLVDDVAAFRRPHGVAALHDISRKTAEMQLWRPTCDGAPDVFARLPQLLCKRSLAVDASESRQQQEDEEALRRVSLEDTTGPRRFEDIEKVPRGETEQVVAVSISVHADLAAVNVARRLRPPLMTDAAAFLPSLRDELYVTLVSGSFSQDAKLSARSVEVRARLVKDTGEVVACVSRSSESVELPGYQYRSSVNYHGNKPTWMETVRFELPRDDDLSRYHVHFSFAHSRTESKKPPRSVFAMAFMPLAQAAEQPIVEEQHEEAEATPMTPPPPAPSPAPSSSASSNRRRRRQSSRLAAAPVADGEHRLACYEPNPDDENAHSSKLDSVLLLRSYSSNSAGSPTTPKKPPSPSPSEGSSEGSMLPVQYYYHPSPSTPSASKLKKAPSYLLPGGVRQRGRRMSAGGAASALLSTKSLFTSNGAVAQAAAAAGGEREWFLVRTRLVSDRRVSAEHPELHDLLRWRALPPGAETIRAIGSALSTKTVKSSSDKKKKKPARREIWPNALRQSLRALLGIVRAERAPGEPEAAFSALVDTLSTFAAANHTKDNKKHHRATLRRSLAEDQGGEGGVLPSCLRKHEQDTAGESFDDDDSDTDVWGSPSSGDDDDYYSCEEDEPEVVKTLAEDSWTTFVAASVRRELSVSTSEASEAARKVVESSTVHIFMKKEALENTVHGTLLDHCSRTLKWLDDDDDDEGPLEEELQSALLLSTLRSLDCLMALACASFIRSGGRAVEAQAEEQAALLARDNVQALIPPELSFLGRVDEILDLCKGLLKGAKKKHKKKQQQMRWLSDAKSACVESLAGTFEVLEACLPLAAVAERATRLVRCLPATTAEKYDARSLAAELVLLNGLVTSEAAQSCPIGRRELTPALAVKCAASLRRARSNEDDAASGALAVLRGLAAILISNIAHHVGGDISSKLFLKETGLLPEALEALISATASRTGSSSRRNTNNNNASSLTSSYWSDADLVVFGSPPEACFLLEAGRAGVQEDALQDLCVGVFALLSLDGALEDPGVVHAALRASSAMVVDTPFPIEWPLLGSFICEVFSKVLAHYNMESSSSEDLRRFFQLGLALLEAPETDVTAMSDERLAYVLRVAGGDIADLRTATVLLLDSTWKTLDEPKLAYLERPLLPRLARLLGSNSNSVAALATKFWADLILAHYRRYKKYHRRQPALGHPLMSESSVSSSGYNKNHTKRRRRRRKQVMGGVPTPSQNYRLLERRLLDTIDDDAKPPGAGPRLAKLAVALSHNLPRALQKDDDQGAFKWFAPSLDRASELVGELRELVGYPSRELERGRAYGRLLAANGPLLRADAEGHFVRSLTRRAAIHARMLASEMTEAGHHVEAGIAMLKAAESDDLAEQLPADDSVIVVVEEQGEEQDMSEEEESSSSEQEEEEDLEARAWRRRERGVSGMLTPKDLADVDEVDEIIALTLGSRAGRLAVSRREAQRSFERARPAATELALSCAEAAVEDLRRSLQRPRLPRSERSSVRTALSTELRRTASFYDALQHTSEQPLEDLPVIFRCRFFKGASPALRSREFAFRADPGEQLIDFVNRLRAMMPKLELLGPSHVDGLISASSPHHHQEEAAGAVEVQASRLRRVALDEIIVEEQEFQEALENPTRLWPRPLSAEGLFDESAPWRPSRVWAHEWPVTPFQREEESVLDVWLVRRLLLLTEALPSSSRWVGVEREHRVRLNPLEVALRQLLGKNLELRSTYAKLNDAEDAGAEQQHTMAINGVVDAAVNGGLRNWTPLFNGQHRKTHPEIQADIVANSPRKEKNFLHFVEALRDHLQLVQRCVVLHRLKCPPALRPLADHIDRTSWPRFQQECTSLLAAAAKDLQRQASSSKRKAAAALAAASK